jgi:hypothetical protein
MMKSLYAFVTLSLIAFGCTDLPPGPSPAPHMVPGVGSEFWTHFRAGFFDTNYFAVATTVDTFYEGHKHVSLYTEGRPIAYEENGDISIRYRHGWITLPLKTKQPIVIPTVRFQSTDSTYSLIDQTVTYDGEETVTVDSNKLACVRFHNMEIYRDYDGHDRLLRTDTTDGDHLVWSPEIGYVARIQMGVDFVGNPKETLIYYDLK